MWTVDAGLRSAGAYRCARLLVSFFSLWHSAIPPFRRPIAPFAISLVALGPSFYDDSIMAERRARQR